MIEKHEAWYRQCSGDKCGVRIQVSLENPETGERAPISEPTNQHPNCMLCGSPWGPWIPGEAPEYDDEVD